MNLCCALPPEVTGHPALVTRLADPASVEAVVVGGNPLAADDAATRAPRAALDGPAPRVVLWSGTLGDGLFDPHPATWLSTGRRRLDEVCARLAPAARDAGKTICFRPHARHVLSDVPSCLQFLRDHEDEPLEIALSPGTMIEPSMVDVVEDHLERFFAALGGRSALCFLDDVMPDATGADCRLVPLGQGVLPAAAVRGLLERFVPADVSVVLAPEAIDAQRGWLGV